MNYNTEATSFTFRRGSEVSQDYTVIVTLFKVLRPFYVTPLTLSLKVCSLQRPPAEKTLLGDVESSSYGFPLNLAACRSGVRVLGFRV